MLDILSTFRMLLSAKTILVFCCPMDMKVAKKK